MSLSTLTQCSPRVCPRTNLHTFETHHEPRRTIDWGRVAHATAVAAAATALSQFVAAPLDVGTRARHSFGTNANFLAALSSVARKDGILALFSGLPLNLLKRSPTKALTVAIFEIGTQSVLVRSASQNRPPMSAFHHLSIAISSGALAMMATYPIHSSYYALRKGIAFSNIVSCARLNPQVIYSGTIPALISTAPAVMIDYALYKHLRKQISSGSADKSRATKVLQTAALVTAAASSNLAGGIISEPFKALSRRMAVDSFRHSSCGSIAVTARTMMSYGPGEFWRGFPVRSVRYALSAVVSKTTVQHLQRKRKQVAVVPDAIRLSCGHVTLSGKKLGAGVVECRTSEHYSVKAPRILHFS